MSPDTFNKDFARAFTQDCILYSPTEEYRYGNMLFMQFAGNDGEMRSIATSVSKNMYQSQLVSRIISLLENKSIPEIELLCSTANNLIDEFRSYIQHEAYESTYCNELIHTMESFHALINSVKDDMHEQVLNKLTSVCQGIGDPSWDVEIDSSYLYPAVQQIEFYLKNLLTYYYHFLIVSQQENDSCKGIGLTTQVADYLLELTVMIEMVSNSMEDVLDMLLTWEVCMDMCEEQALYN